MSAVKRTFAVAISWYVFGNRLRFSLSVRPDSDPMQN